MNTINFNFLDASIRREINCAIYDMIDNYRLMWNESYSFKDFTPCIKSDEGRLLVAFINVKGDFVEFYKHVDGFGLDFVDRMEANETYSAMLDGYIELTRYARKEDVK